MNDNHEDDTVEELRETVTFALTPRHLRALDRLARAPSVGTRQRALERIIEMLTFDPAD